VDVGVGVGEIGESNAVESSCSLAVVAVAVAVAVGSSSWGCRRSRFSARGVLAHFISSHLNFLSSMAPHALL
jgi:hypothetical protein